MDYLDRLEMYMREYPAPLLIRQGRAWFFKKVRCGAMNWRLIRKGFLLCFCEKQG